MPYCVQCGQQVGTSDQFCAKCGTPQQTRPSQPPPDPAKPAPENPTFSQSPTGSQSPTDFWNTMPDRTVTLLCYLPWIGWIVAVAVLASARFRHDKRIRFHAFQGIYIFVAWLLVEWVVSPMSGSGRDGFRLGPIVGVMHLIVLAAWIFMLVKVNQNEDYHLPILGNLAEKSVNEQQI